jgi:N-acetylglucosamine-6-phosphate deacetylase
MDGVTIAGSVLTMNRAVSNAVTFIGLDLVKLAYMASLLPARFCDAGHRKGSIEAGKDADVAIFDRSFVPRHTIVRGEVVFSA